jgi:isopropylmalate/homocitrate/citramalate synthase
MPQLPVFTPEEIQALRAALNRYRQPGAYEPGRWMVSPLNRRPAVLGGAFPRAVTLRDITLRTTEQMPGLVLGPEERRRLLTAIVEAGAPSVQLSAFRRGWTLEAMRAEVDLVKRLNPACEVVYGHVKSREEVALAKAAGVDSVQFWAAPYVEAAPLFAGVYEQAWRDQDWRAGWVPRTVEAQLAQARALVLAGKELGVRVSAGLNQIPFAPEEYVVRYCRAMHECGAPEILLYDGPSGVGPEAYAWLVALVRREAPEAVVGVHTHNMFDLAVANACAATRAGASVLEVSVNGYCSASGQADLAATTMALTALYGVETGIVLDRLTPLARLAEELTGYRVAWNHPVTGPEVFNWGGTEFVIQELKVDPLIHWCIEPTLVGNERRWDITADSGPYTMLDKLRGLGVDVDLALVEPVLAATKAEMRRRRRVLTDDELRALARRVAAQAGLESA